MSLSPVEIVTHLQRYLPSVIDIFSDEVTGTASAVGNLVTVNSVGHGLSVGNQIVATAGMFQNLLSSVVDNGDGTVRFTTSQEHDLTEPSQYADPQNLELIDFGNEWDGLHAIVAIPNRQTFEIAFPSGVVVLPTLGTGKLNEDRSAGILGNQTVDSVIDANTFTFTVSNVPSFPTGQITGFKSITQMRIFAAADFDRAVALYNRKMEGQAALFVIMGDVTVSKDRYTSNDSIGSFTTQNLQKLTVLNEFSTSTFIPTKNDIAGNAAQQLAYKDLTQALLKVLFGFTFEDPDTTLTYTTVLSGHGAGEYNSAYYVHVHDWERPDVITTQEGFEFVPNVAWRDIDMTLLQNGDPSAEWTANINLDDEEIS